MNVISYPVTVFYLRERPRPGDGATVNDAAGKLVCVVPLHEHARVIADALNFFEQGGFAPSTPKSCAEQRVGEVTP